MLQQQNFKQRVVALLKRFRVSDEVGAYDFWEEELLGMLQCVCVCVFRYWTLSRTLLSRPTRWRRRTWTWTAWSLRTPATVGQSWTMMTASSALPNPNSSEASDSGLHFPSFIASARDLFEIKPVNLHKNTNI